MILEQAILNVKPGQGAAFEAAMAEAIPLIKATDGFVRLEVRNCIEAGERYLLLVWWETLESHTVNFRQSARYQDWRRLLHHFYDPAPIVDHYKAPFVSAER